MKKIYICGDSFGVPDPDYKGLCWVEILQTKLSNIAEVVSLASVCASNLLIGLQAREAIEKKADYIICLGTSCTRYEAKFTNNKGELLDRFINKDLLSYSILSLNETTIFTHDQLLLLKEYHTKFFDLDVAIYENQCIIENTLQNLVDSKIPFKFDRGGFEHPSYGNSKNIPYFEKYKEYISGINLWDYPIKRTYRPYFHITDSIITEKISNYYYDTIISTIG